MTDYKLYGNEMSYYTGKVRAYLDWKELAYAEVLPTLDVFKTILLPQVGRAIIPVLETPQGEFIQDSRDIITTLESRHTATCAMPSGPQQTLVTLLLELFADEWLIIPALHYRWAHNNEWSYLEFGKTSLPEATEAEQYAAGKKNARFFENWQPEVGISDTTIPAIEQTYIEFLGMLSAHFAEHKFLFGARPTYADFAFYGPLYAHLYRDPTSGQLMRDLAPRVCEWVERCQRGTTTSKAADPGLLADDAIPTTLKPILAWQMREQLPVLLESARRLDGWAQSAQNSAPLPRGFGMIDITIGNCRGTCLARSFPLYRAQTAIDHYQAMAPNDQARADALLNEVGGSAFSDFKLSQPLTRKANQLVIAS